MLVFSPVSSAFARLSIRRSLMLAFLLEEYQKSSLKDAYALARQQLAMLAAESGNVIYRASKVKDLEGVYQQVIRDLSTVHSIGYRPENPVRGVAWRAVSVQLVGHPELAVRTKRGYYGR